LPANGSWTASNGNKLTYTAGLIFTQIYFYTQCFYSRNGIGRIGYLIKQGWIRGDKKSQDNYAEVGSFQVTLTAHLKIVRQLLPEVLMLQLIILETPVIT
jgi:hypothetical protein